MSTPLAPAYESPWERLTAAALAYADASDDEEEFAKARDRLRKAALAYAGANPEPPVRKPHPQVRKVPTSAQLDLWGGAARSDGD
ncbi:hypothetical protein [Myxococcus sp. NMCA1]|uniref:hypothetical protein n=1 Tax=Myxococcus sp. NMCA1 TaxID=2996785 RepID=UPI0022856189|nr:hypothetical protein [Myxococcus sp. NMCA1]WAM23839.1 hypothetical protein OZ403_25190 [Myxococcus sp. NMCA1]